MLWKVTCAVLLLVGCGARGDYERGQSLGHVPCEFKDIKVLSLYENTPSGDVGFWSVECAGVRYQCARQLAGFGAMMVGLPTGGAASAMQPIQCQALAAQPATAPVSAPPAAVAPVSAPPAAVAPVSAPPAAVARPLLDSDLASGPVVGDATVKVLYAPSCADYQWLVSSKRERAVLINSVSAAIEDGYSWAAGCTPPGR